MAIGAALSRPPTGLLATLGACVARHERLNMGRRGPKTSTRGRKVDTMHRADTTPELSDLSSEESARERAERSKKAAPHPRVLQNAA